MPRCPAAACYARAPRLGGLLAFAAVASLGLPGLAGFWGELLAMTGAYRPAAVLHRDHCSWSCSPSPRPGRC